MQNRIREIRERRGLTLQALAALAGTTHQQIMRLEKGERRLTTLWMARIADALGVQASDLIADGLSADERALLNSYRKLPSDRKLLARPIIETLAESDRPFGEAQPSSTSPQSDAIDANPTRPTSNGGPAAPRRRAGGGKR